MAMNSSLIKPFAVVILLGTMIGLAWICQPSSERPISVSMLTPLNEINPKKAKIVLKAGLNGQGVSHGKVKLDFTLTNGGNLGSYPNPQCCIEGFTDAHGVFISNWTPGLPGDYMVTASVKKPGCVDGQSVCFLRVAKY
jgi:hypothetical protein